MTVAEQTAELVAALPPGKAEEVLDFARFLAERIEEEAWRERLDNAHKLPKFRAFVEDVEREIAEGKATPMDPGQL